MRPLEAQGTFRHKYKKIENFKIFDFQNAITMKLINILHYLFNEDKSSCFNKQFKENIYMAFSSKKYRRT